MQTESDIKDMNVKEENKEETTQSQSERKKDGLYYKRTESYDAKMRKSYSKETTPSKYNSVNKMVRYEPVLKHSKDKIEKSSASMITKELFSEMEENFNNIKSKLVNQTLIVKDLRNQNIKLSNGKSKKYSYAIITISCTMQNKSQFGILKGSIPHKIV